MAGSGINANAMHKENRPAHDRIAEMFTDWLVSADNMEYWNGEMKRHADALAKAEAARAAKSQIEKEIAAASAPPKFEFDEIFPELMKAAGEWSRLCMSGSADFATKRNLIMSTVDALECVVRSGNHIKF